MPFICAKISEPLTQPQIEAIKNDLGKAISLLPGKSEAYLMVEVEDQCHLYFKGDSDAPTAMCEVSVFGKAPRDACEALTGAICESLQNNAFVSPSRCYVKFQFADTWGYDGYLF